MHEILKVSVKPTKQEDKTKPTTKHLYSSIRYYIIFLFVIIRIAVPVGHQKADVSLFQTNSLFLLEGHCD